MASVCTEHVTRFSRGDGGAAAGLCVDRSDRVWASYLSSSRRLAASLNNIGTMYHREGRASEALDHYQRAVRVRMESLRDATEESSSAFPAAPLSATHTGLQQQQPRFRPELATEVDRQAMEAQKEEQLLRKRRRSGTQQGLSGGNRHMVVGLDLFDLSDEDAAAADVADRMDEGDNASAFPSSAAAVCTTDEGSNAAAVADSSALPLNGVVFSEPLCIAPPSPCGDNTDLQDHRGSATTLYNIGLVHASHGSLDKASQLLQMARSIVDPANEPALMACILNDFARVKYKSQDPSGAMKILTKALHLEQAAFAKQQQHIEDEASQVGTISLESTIIATLTLMSRLHFAHGDASKAAELGREVLRIRRSIMGDDHLEVGCTLYNLGLTLYRLGHVEDAIRHCAYFASMFLGSDTGMGTGKLKRRDLPSPMFAPNSPLAGLSPGARDQVGTALHNLGVLYLDNDSVSESLRCLEAALALRRSAWEEEKEGAGAATGTHPHIADTLYQLGQIYQNTGNDRVAMEHFREAARIFRVTIGPDHEDVAVVCCAMGQIHQVNGETDEALTVYSEVLRIAKITFGPYDNFVGEVLGIIGNVHLERGCTEMAMLCFAESSRITGEGQVMSGVQRENDQEQSRQQQPLIIPSLAGFRLRCHAAAA